MMVAGATGIPRDRDAAGRARNSRPRDSLGRPLPYGSADVERQPEGVVRTPVESIEQAQQLLESGLPFHAHEVFEDAWKSSSGPDRELWKGLAQLAVGLTHLSRGNMRGAQTLLQRGTRAIAAYRDQPPFNLDIAGVLRWSAELTTRLDAAQAVSQVSWVAPMLVEPDPGVATLPAEVARRSPGTVHG